MFSTIESIQTQAIICMNLLTRVIYFLYNLLMLGSPRTQFIVLLRHHIFTISHVTHRATNSDKLSRAGSGQV